MTVLPSLTADERTRLIGVLGRLGSDFAGERAAAGLLATRLPRTKGLGWGDVVVGGEPVQRRREAPHRAHDRRTDLSFCQQHLRHCSVWEQDFILSLTYRRRSLSPAQQAKLAEIARELRRRGCT